jgi:hypothetical protein
VAPHVRVMRGEIRDLSASLQQPRRSDHAKVG